MIKRMIILIVMGLTLSSCQLFTEAIKDNINRVERARERKAVRKKDGPAAIGVDEYKEGVEEAIKDVLKRPINKKVEFKGTTLIIPEDTRINPKHGNIVDEKTGYGIFISFSINSHCISKKVNNKKYSFFFDKNDANVAEIAKEIMRVNGFEDTCK
ncbi:hypothetical protein I6H56_01840 [Fusobacterium canifelinum]|uniref:Lipoprotein n=1 Tax=Fusobacterium canifelinum TaxID=285729 RepID=A0A7T4FPH6_9FUSO|nr:hypothetical protein [Fusobacterium canifelinum]QQB74239.1 hypothetical protein I6H56_01840 [Fusobacterium canifelinum]